MYNAVLYDYIVENFPVDFEEFQKIWHKHFRPTSYFMLLAHNLIDAAGVAIDDNISNFAITDSNCNAWQIISKNIKLKFDKNNNFEGI